MATNPGGYDWKSEPETDLFTISGYKTNKKGKKKPKYIPYDPADPENTGPGGSGSGSGGKAPSSTAPGSMGNSNPGGYDPSAKREPNMGTNPAGFASAVTQGTEQAFPGSFATNYAGKGDNPEALGMVANNPMYIANTLAANQFGLPAGSNTANAMNQYLNPQQKWMGLLGEAPTQNSDWINFGEALMNSSALKQPGADLSASGMMQNVVSVLQQEFKNMASGGSGVSDQFNPITALAQMNPEDALTSFVTMIKGMLQGTMPDDILNAYANFITRQGQAFAQQFVGSSMGELEGKGANFLSALVDQLGPSLGL